MLLCNCLFAEKKMHRVVCRIKWMLPIFWILYSSAFSTAQNSTKNIDQVINYAKKISDTDVLGAHRYLTNQIEQPHLNQLAKSKIEVELSVIELKRGNVKQSLQNAINALKYAEESKNPVQLGMVYMQFGMIYKKLALFLKAAYYYKLAEEQYKIAGNQNLERQAFLYQAHVYTDYGKEKTNNYFLYTAEKMYDKLLKNAQLVGDEVFENISYNNLANLYLVKFEIDSNYNWLKSCNKYACKAIQLSKKLKNEVSLGVSYSNYAESFGLLGELDSATTYFNMANAIYVRNHVIHYYFYNSRTISKLLIDNKQYENAEKILDDYLIQIQRSHENFEFKNYYSLKAELEAKTGNYKEAFENRLLYSKVMEQLREDESAKELVRLQFLYDVDKKDKEIKILNKNEKLREINSRNQKWIRNLLLFGLLMLVVILVFVYLRYREKNRLNKTIVLKNNELQRLSIVASNTSNAIAVTDKACKIVWVNDGFLKLYGFSSIEEVLEKIGLDYFNFCGLTRAEINQYIDEIQNSKRSAVFQAFKAKKSGEQSFIQTNLTPVFDKNDNLEQMIFIDTDITELLEAREIAIREKRKAENALKTQELFLANVSHEIRTPMNGIIGLTRQLSEELQSEQHKEITNSIHISAESLLHVVNDLLDVSKIRAGKMSIEKTSFSLLNLIENLKKAIEFRVTEKGLKLVIEKDTNLTDVVLGDPIRLNQVLLNLVSNAIKFTIEGEVAIKIKVLYKNDLMQEVKFEISDTGIGIPANKIETVFDHFTQLEDHRTRTASGTGLGLGISKSLVEAMGGNLSLSSKEGKGTQIQFTLNFEIDQKGDEFVEKAHEVVLHKDLTGLKILLVEDNSINQKVIIHDLKKWNCDIDVVDDAFEAIERLKNNMYDVILMDYYMPRMDGIETTQYIRSKFPEPVKSIPIIAITASAMRGDNDKFLQAGMNDYISKPFNPEKLYHLLVKWGFNEDSNLTVSESNTLKISVNKNTIDLSLLREKADGDNEYLREMFGAYLEMMPVYKDELMQHFLAQNWLEVKKSAHQILSPAKLFGLLEAIPSLEILQKDDSLTIVQKEEQVHLVVKQIEESIVFISEELKKIN